MTVTVIIGPVHFPEGESMASVCSRMDERAIEYDWIMNYNQSNHEGEIIDLLEYAKLHSDAVILNAGAYNLYSYAIRDAVAAMQIPVIEVQLATNIHEPYRNQSVIAPVCRGSIHGFGVAGYVIAMEALIEIIE